MTTLHVVQTIFVIMALGIGIAVLFLTARILLDDYRLRKQDFGAKTTEKHCKTEVEPQNCKDKNV